MLTTYPIIHINEKFIHAKKRISFQGRAPPLHNNPNAYFEPPSTFTLELGISNNVQPVS
jgi:hypothetical protein